MAGLLDILDSDQGRLGIGLLAAAGPSATPMGFGQRLAQGVGYVKQQKDADLERLVKQAQLGDIQAQAALRKAQADKQSRLLDSINQWMGGGDVKAGNDAVIGQTGGLAPTVESAQIQQGAMAKANPLMGIPPQAIQADLAFNDGKGIAEWLFKRGTPNMQINNGYAVDMNAVKPGFMPGLHTSQDGKSSLTTIGPDGQPVISAPAGAVDTWMNYRSGDAPVKIPLSSGQEVSLFPKEVADYVNSGTLPARLGLSPENTSLPNRGNAQLTPALQKLILDDARKNGISAPVVNINAPQAGQTMGLQGEAKTPQAPSMPGKTPTFGMTQSPADAAAQKLSNEAASDLNKSWIKSSYEPIVAAGQSAQGVIETSQVARNALKALGGGGWGTEAKATFANVLAGLGVAPENAKLYAANAQIFQKTAMDRLWATLNEAKGPQTEGDVDRASKTFASLKNTPQANEFILDMTQAKAEREKLRANFYSHALPVARASGDLPEVDREWSKRMPSIFDMPSMKKYAK